MISRSQSGKARAASRSSFVSTAMPRLKLAAYRTGTSCAASRSLPRCAVSSPVVPQTKATLCARQCASAASKPAGVLKSITMSSSGTWLHSSELLTHAAKVNRGSSFSSDCSARPMRPLAPVMARRIFSAMECTSSLDQDFVELDVRRNIRVIRHVALKLLGVRHESFEKCLDAGESVKAGGDVFGRRAGFRSTDAALDRHRPESRVGAEQFDGSRHVLRGVVVEIEAPAAGPRVKDAYLDHAFPIQPPRAVGRLA